ncbi:IS200/IS605 family element transposase accessory protein TnpB [Pseudomonas putida]|nr:IS200/IS605 family element transposase accessory protein TnpB [Pseudomonas putida]
MQTTKSTKTLKVRIKDKHAPLLREWARSVNFAWNYINELSSRSIRERGRFLSAYQIQAYTNGASKELGLHSQTIQGITDEYVIRRKQFKKRKLRWRASGGARRSLGWVPFKVGAAKWLDGQVVFNKQHFKVWDSYGLSQYRFRSGSFTEDSRGRWYFNVVVDVDRKLSPGQDNIGIDLGLKTVATCSDAQVLENANFYAGMEKKLGCAQRAGLKARTKAIHAKIANRRKDALHKFSNALVARCGLIVVGDVSSHQLVKTQMAKSVLDAGWGQLKSMLEYKCENAGIHFMVVNENYTTQTCSSCQQLPASRPKGIAGLGIREWICSECGVTHDRDVNAARNILALGHERLAVGIPH